MHVLHYYTATVATLPHVPAFSAYRSAFPTRSTMTISLLIIFQRSFLRVSDDAFLSSLGRTRRNTSRVALTSLLAASRVPVAPHPDHRNSTAGSPPYPRALFVVCPRHRRAHSAFHYALGRLS